MLLNAESVNKTRWRLLLSPPVWSGSRQCIQQGFPKTGGVFLLGDFRTSRPSLPFDGLFVWDVTAHKELFFVCFSDNHLETVEEKRRSCVLSASHHYTKGKVTGVFNMRGMWVIFFCIISCSVFADDDFTFSAIGPALCGYNQFRYNSECYDYDDNDISKSCKTVHGSACLDAFVSTSDELNDHYPFSVFFGSIGHATNFIYTAGGTCSGFAAYGSACFDAFVATSDELNEHYPFDVGFSAVPYPLNNQAKKLAQDCLGTMDGYYTMNMSQYSKLVDSKCADGSSEYEILNDCQNIDMSIADASDTRSPLHPDNMMCAVLCNSGSVYSSTGACLEYCHVNGQQKRFHIMRDGTHIEFPLWADALTTPAVHIQFEDKTVCHLNLTTDVKKDALGIKYQDTVYYSTK